MSEMSKASRTEERNLILSDCIICSVLSIEAEAIGITLEEYIDRFLDVFYNEPSRLESIIER